MSDRTIQIHQVRVDIVLKLTTEELRRLQELTPIDSTVRETLHEIIALGVAERLATMDEVPIKLSSTASTMPMDHNEMMKRMKEYQAKMNDES